MDIIAHINALPWQLGDTFLLRLLDQAVVAVFQLAVIGLAYAGLHRLLSNRTQKNLPNSDQALSERALGRGWKFQLKTHYQESIHDET